MNTACQVKKHTNKSASKKNGHILRHGKDADIIIYQNHKNDFSCNTNKKLPCIEKNIVKKITEIKNKINVYTKRLTEYINRGDVPVKRLNKIEKQIKDLNKDLNVLQKNPVQETRGKKRTKNYFELELSLTNSNHLKNDVQVQNAVANAVGNMMAREELNPILDNMQILTQVMHLDQYSIHEHLLFKVNDNATIDNALKALTPSNDGRDGVGLINDIFHEEMEKELNKLGIDLEEQEHGKVYLSLEEYKKINPINDDIEDFGKLEKSEQMENLIEQMEAQTPDKSKALNLNKPEVQEVQELEKAPKKIRKNR